MDEFQDTKASRRASCGWCAAGSLLRGGRHNSHLGSATAEAGGFEDIAPRSFSAAALVELATTSAAVPHLSAVETVLEDVRAWSARSLPGASSQRARVSVEVIHTPAGEQERRNW